MSEFESPDALLRRIYDAEFGFLPTNSSMKPVHVANGLFRRIAGVTTDFRPLGEVVRQYKLKGNKTLVEGNPNDAILTKYGSRFTDGYGNVPSDEKMTAFRSLAKETLGADGAAFDTGQSSFTLSHRRMITTDVSDNGSGDLLAGFLLAGADQRPARGAELVCSLLEEETDPWTMIGWPMLDVGDEREATLAGAAQVRAERVVDLLGTDASGYFESPTLRVLRARSDQLAEYEAAYGAKLTTLRRIVLFGCFCVHVHMIRRCGDVVPDGPRPPILLDLFDGRKRSLREASAATLQAGFRAIEQLVLHRIGEHIATVAGDDVEGFLDSLPVTDDNDTIRAEYDAQRLGVDPKDALAEAYWRTGYAGVGPTSVKGFPWHALLALGRRSGYLLPQDDRGRGGKEHKRYGANAEFAEVLVAATVAPGDPLDFDDFLDRLRESFGIVVGRRVDFDIIRRNDLRQGAALQRSVSVNENDLRLNLLAFKNLIIDIGFAKSYADGRTVVTTDEAREVIPMPSATQRPDAALMAELLAKAIGEAHGRPGVLVRDVHLDPQAVLTQLQALRDDGLDLRIAYLNPEAETAAGAAGIPDDIFSTQVEDAERWRNEPGLAALVVVITESDAAKLTSLDEFAIIGPGRLRRLLVDRAGLQLTEVNDVLPRWWEIIGNDEQISFSDLVDYYLALESLSGDAVKSEAALQINRLGLLPDPGFFDNPGEKQLRTRLDDNRTLALRLANFSEEDRQKVDKALADEEDDTRRASLRRQLRELQEYRRGGQLGLTSADAQQLLKVRSGKPKPVPPPLPGGTPSPPPPPPPKDLTELAVDGLLTPTPAPGDQGGVDGDDVISGDVLDGAVAALRDEIDKIEDTVRPRPIKVGLPNGLEIDEEVKTDVLNLVSRMVDEQKYGGLVKADGDDVAAMVRNFEQSAEVVQTWEGTRVRKFLDAFAETSADYEPIRAAFNEFAAAREALLPHLRELCIVPLLVAAAPATHGLIEPVIDAYRTLLDITTKSYSALHQSFGDDARALIEFLMLLDTVFLDNGESLVALLTPLHPLLLWHYFEYARVITEQRDTLDARDRALVRSEFESGGVPLFLASLGVPRSVSDNAPLSLPFSGKFGALPHFSERAAARDPKDGVRPVRRLIEAFVAMHPSAAEGLRLALLEPPDAGAFLTVCCELAELSPPRLRGAHISVLRRGQGIGAELNLSTDEERRVQQRFGDHVNRRYTFETLRVGPTELTPPDDVMPHLYVAFDQTRRHSASAGGQLQKIQPLANRRRLAYHIDTETLDLEPALGGILADYSSFAKLAVGPTIISYQTIHQNDELQARLRQGAADVPWYVVVDGHVDRDLDLGGLRVLTDREGTRDVAAFTRSPDAFRRSLRDVVRQFNTYVADDTLDGLLASLSELLDAGLMALRPGKSGEIVHSHVKGILGLMVAVQSLRNTTPEGHDRIILSLDDEQARRWLHLNEDNDKSRSDLLVIDGADDQFTVTVVEVKARQDISAEYAVTNGEVSGPAINQLLSTHRILRRVFDTSTPDLLLTPSRREIIREHLYRELSKASYDSAAKRRWAERSRKLFDEVAEVDLRCALIDVQLGLAAASLEPSRDVQAVDGEQLVRVSLRHLNEDGVPGLEEALTPPENPPDQSGAEPAPDVDDGGGGGLAGGGDGAQPGSGATETTPAPGGEAAQAAVVATPDGARPRVLVGHSTGTYGGQREVWYDPQGPEKLSNPHISITGETGTGKTQATKAILHDLLPQGVPALILDFKDDYSKADYAEAEGFTVHDASFGSLPFNPMVPPVDRLSGRVNPTSHLHELSNMLQRIYGLGDQQAFQLREAMKETYAINGIGTKPFIPSAEQYLPFEAIRDVLVREKQNALLGRLSPVFDLGLFSEGDAATTLNELLSTPTVIRLAQLPGDQVKNAVAEFFLMGLYSFLIRREQPHKLERLLVLDEAWRLVNSPFLKPLMLEGRAFGLGVIVATQFPRQLPEEVSGSTATRLFFNQTKAEQVRDIQRTLVGKTSGQEADHVGGIVRGLAPLECVFQNAHYRPWVRVRVTPYYARLAETASDE